MRRILFLVLFGLSQTALYAQSSHRFDAGKSFSFSNYSEAYSSQTYDQPGEADNIIRAILSVVGLKPNFQVRAADIANAAAVVYDGERYILYDREFIQSINDVSSTSWAGISILAHEIGHHLNGHTLSSGGSNPKDELEADEFSGFVLRKLGADLEEAQAAMHMLAEDYQTSSHPERNRRLKAIALGWNNAGDQQLAKDFSADGTKVQGYAIEQTMAPQLLSSKHILREVHFTHAPENKFYITTNYNLVEVKQSELLHYGELQETNNREFPFVLTDGKRTVIIVSHDGNLFDAEGDKIGFMRAYKGS